MSNDKEEMENHRLNYRISFDAMRAYHSSEIEHKKDMITILNGVLVSIITVYGGFFYFILSKDYSLYILWALVGIPLITCLYIVMIYRLKRAHIEKIESDHQRYEKFKEECNLERDYLGLTKYFAEKKLPETEMYWDKNKKPTGKEEKSGYEVTIRIINIYCSLLTFISICLSLVAFLILFQKIMVYFLYPFRHF